MKKHSRGKDCYHIVLFFRIPCLNFNHVIVMKDFHNVFAYYNRSKPQKNQMSNKLHFLISCDVIQNIFVQKQCTSQGIKK
jgi:hypothetical protein